jgi:cytochrome c553
MKHTILSTVLLLGLSPLAASAAGDATAGKTKSFTCMGCHGIPNYTNVYPSYRVPKIGGQHAEYLVSALQSYKSGQRSHATMQAQAGSLSDQDMEDIAAYFAGMSGE